MDLDSVFLKVGDFGPYQWVYNYLLCGLASLYAAPYCLSYVFTSLDLSYRCFIPECESVDDAHFVTSWLKVAIPYDETKGLAKCERYLSVNGSDTGCTVGSFNRSIIVPCTEWIYEYPFEKNILTEFNMQCNENQWKLTLVGTLNTIARILGMPLTAFISDRFGRRYVIIFGTCLSCLFGTLRALSTTYEMFVTLEVLDAFFAAGFYNCAIVLAVELISPKRRIWATLIINYFYTFGDVLIGTIGYFVRYWRHFLIILYLPGVLFISYFWIMPESIRWLISQKRYDEAAAIIEKMARWNKVQLDFDVKESLCKSSGGEDSNSPKMTYLQSVLEASKSPTLMFRLAIISFCWMNCSFIWYGVTQQATLIQGDMYINFIISSLMQFPAYLLAVIVSGFGRKKPLSLAFVSGAVTSLASYLIPSESLILRISLVMISKLIISCAFLFTMVLSAEMFPTELRHSMVAAANMFGMIAQSFAPQMPLLVTYFGTYFPMLVYSITNILAALLCFFLPETSTAKLTDTIKAARNQN
uniref:Organic cation transporter-like protein n=1 Tax=Cacopsylla melanoneura TaxID=428564 RepID=A0A8D9E0J8_9HEMI